MDRLRWKDLSDDLKRRCLEAGVVAECGPGHGLMAMAVPELVFHETCLAHDFDYWVGGDEVDRAWADREFLDLMELAVEKQSWWLRPIYGAAAWLYWKAVRRAASKSFYYVCRPQTIEHLMAHLATMGV